MNNTRVVQISLVISILVSSASSWFEKNHRGEAASRTAKQLELLHDVADPVVSAILLNHHRLILNRQNPKDFCHRADIPSPQGMVTCSVWEVEEKGIHSGGNLPSYHIRLSAFDNWRRAAVGYDFPFGEVRLVLYPDGWIDEPAYVVYHRSLKP